MDVQTATTIEALSGPAAAWVAERAREAVAARGLFTLALAGGQSPRSLYERLTSLPAFPWAQTRLFWSDERAVPPTDAQSNFALAQRSLLAPLALPEQQVHRMRAEVPDLLAEAQAYEETIRRWVPPDASGESIPCFDLILLGVGADGHTASLFPGDAALWEDRRWVVPVWARLGTPPVPRLTFTFTLINNARHVAFLTGAAGKEPVLRALLHGQGREYPAARVQPREPAVWFVAGWPTQEKVE